MKAMRLWLLLLVAVLLPVRGALAVAMQCAAPAAPAAVHAAQPYGHGEHHRVHAPAHHPADDAAQSTGMDKCSICAASCGAGLPGHVPALTGPMVAAAVSTRPDLAPPSFVPDTPERPPRTH